MSAVLDTASALSRPAHDELVEEALRANGAWEVAHQCDQRPAFRPGTPGQSW